MTEKPLLTYLPCLFVLFLWVLLCICLSFSALTSLPSHITHAICFSFMVSLKAAGVLCVPRSTSLFLSLCSYLKHTASILVLKQNPLWGHLKAMSFSDQLPWRGVKLRHNCTKLDRVSPWMGLGSTTYQGSAFAL